VTPAPEQLVAMLTTQARWLRQSIAFGYTLQFAACLAGAACLYAAIDDFLIGHPVRSAVFTGIAFWNGLNFVMSRIAMHISWRNLKIVDGLRREVERMRETEAKQ
jgi:hypothetical protein